MDINVNLKITLEETPALMNTLSAFTETLQELRKASATAVKVNVNPDEIASASAPAALQQLPVTPPPAVPAPAAVQTQLPVTPPPAAPVSMPAPAAVPTAAPKQYTLAEIQAACGPLMDAGKMNELAAVMQGMGVNSLMELPPEKYGELAVKLRALGARL